MTDDLWLQADHLDIGVTNFEPTRPEFDPLEATTMKALPVLRSIDVSGVREAVALSDAGHDAITRVMAKSDLRLASLSRTPTWAGRLP